MPKRPHEEGKLFPDARRSEVYVPKAGKTDSLFYKLPRWLAARRDLPAGAKLVYAAIWDRLGDKRESWPGVRTIAGDTGMSIESVIQNIARLESAKLLAVDRGGMNKPNRYSFLRVDSAQQSCAPNKVVRPRKYPPGAQESWAHAPKKVGQNQKDQLNQTKVKRRRRPRAEPTNPQVKTFIDWFAEQYGAAQGRPYVVQGGKDGATVKRLLAALGENGNALAELQSAARTMLADPWGRGNADIGLLSSQINRWRAKSNDASGYGPGRAGGRQDGPPARGPAIDYGKGF